MGLFVHKVTNLSDETKHMSKNWQKQKILRAKAHQYHSYEKINGLVVKNRDGRTITLDSGKKLIEFSSCSYLGLDTDDRVMNAVIDSIHRFGVSFPISRTRMVIDRLQLLEDLLSSMFCGSHAIIFTSLHLATQGILPILTSGEMPSFPMKDGGPVFIIDKRAHASIQINRGTLLQFGKVEMVDFVAQTDQLEHLFKQAYQNKQTPIALSDSIISMGGIVPQSLLVKLAEKYQGYLYLDDAHGTSVIGENGCGYVLDQLGGQLHPRMILAASLSKGFGANGGVVLFPTAADSDMIRKFCGSYIFSNPLPTPVIDAAIASAEIHLSGEVHDLQKKLYSNLNTLDRLLPKIENRGSVSPIRNIFIGNEERAIKIISGLMDRGYIATAAMYPTVAKGSSIIRLAASAVHSPTEIKAIAHHLTELQAIYPRVSSLITRERHQEPCYL